MEERGIKDLLLEHSFFEGMKPEWVEYIAGCGKNVAFNEKDLLAREGDPADAFFAIRHGRVAVQVEIPGSGPRTIHTAEPGDVLGWSWLFPPYRWHFDVRASEVTRAVQFDGNCLRGKCEEDPALGYDFMKRFARVFVDRLKAARLQMMDVYGKTRNS